MTKIYLGSVESADTVFLPDGVLERAGAELDRRREAEALAIAAATTDIGRTQATRRARLARRFRKTLQMFRRIPQ
jgi:hypothetical protein